MVIRNCPNCGGEHWGSTKCPYIELPCVVCGKATVMACADCSNLFLWPIMIPWAKAADLFDHINP